MQTKIVSALVLFGLSMTAFAKAPASLAGLPQIQVEANGRPSPHCVALSSAPSFIIKFKGLSSSPQANNLISSDQLRSLSQAAGVTFTESRIMSEGAYVLMVDGQHLNNSVLPQTTTGCFDPKAVNRLVHALEKRPDVQYVEPNILLWPQGASNVSVPTPPSSTYQWNLFNSRLTTAAGGDGGAWTFGEGSDAVLTAVLDTGVVTNDNLDPNLSTTQVTFAGAGSANNGTSAEPSCDYNVCGSAFHGTFVSGIVAALGTSGPATGVAIAGVAPASKVLPINVFSKASCRARDGSLVSCLTAYLDDVENGVNWLAGEYDPGDGFPTAPNTVRVANLSLGSTSPCGESGTAAFNNANAAGISSVVAAGNGAAIANTDFPGNCSHVVNVAALGPTNTRAYYSNFDRVDFPPNAVALAAPGGDARLPAVGGQIWSTTPDNTYFYGQGTSYAAPMVAGVLELMYAQNSELNPSEASSILRATADSFPVQSGSLAAYDCNYPYSCGAGSLNARAAVVEAKALDGVTMPTITLPLLSQTALVLKRQINPLQACAAGYSYASQSKITVLEGDQVFVWEATTPAACQKNGSYTHVLSAANGLITTSFGSVVYKLIVPPDYSCSVLAGTQIIGCNLLAQHSTRK